MFIKRTIVTRNERRFFQHNLVRSVWRDGKACQEHLLHLGTHYPLPRKHWPCLCSYAQRLMDPTPETFPGHGLPPEVVGEARSIARRIAARGDADA